MNGHQESASVALSIPTQPPVYWQEQESGCPRLPRINLHGFSGVPSGFAFAPLQVNPVLSLTSAADAQRFFVSSQLNGAFDGALCVRSLTKFSCPGCRDGRHRGYQCNGEISSNTLHGGF